MSELENVADETYPVLIREYRIGDKGIFQSGIKKGVKIAEHRIIKLWEQEMKCECEDPMNHLIALIKGETNE